MLSVRFWCNWKSLAGSFHLLLLNVPILVFVWYLAWRYMAIFSNVVFFFLFFQRHYVPYVMQYTQICNMQSSINCIQIMNQQYRGRWRGNLAHQYCANTGCQFGCIWSYSSLIHIHGNAARQRDRHHCLYWQTGYFEQMGEWYKEGRIERTGAGNISSRLVFEGTCCNEPMLGKQFGLAATVCTGLCPLCSSPASVMGVHFMWALL